MNQSLRKIKELNIDVITRTAGKYDIPVMQAVDYVPKKLVGFNQVTNKSGFDGCVHFFIDDFKFLNVWRNLHRQTDRLLKYKGCFSPDFSLYTNYPLATQIYNVYRNMTIGQYFQRSGLICVPTASWSDERSYEFCFDGLPEESTIAISTVGVRGKGRENEESVRLFRKGVEKLIEVKHPTRLLIYGKGIDADYGTTELIYYENTNTVAFNQGIRVGVDA